MSSVSGNHLCGCNLEYDNCDPNVVVFWMPLMAKATNKQKNNIQHALSVLTPSSCCSSFSKNTKVQVTCPLLEPERNRNNMSFQPFKEKSLKTTSLPLILDKTIHFFPAINFFFLS